MSNEYLDNLDAKMNTLADQVIELRNIARDLRRGGDERAAARISAVITKVEGIPTSILDDYMKDLERQKDEVTSVAGDIFGDVFSFQGGK